MNDPDTNPTEPPIAWRCSWAVAPGFAGEYRPKPEQRDFASKEAALQFKQQIKTDSPSTVATVVPFYLKRAVTRQRGDR